MGPQGTFCFVWLSLHQHHTYIIDIRASGAGDDQAVHRLQCMVGVVVLQSVEHIPARWRSVRRRCRRPHSRLQHRWGRRCRRCPPRTPPRPARPAPEPPPAQAPDCVRPGPLPGQVHHRLAARDKGQRLALPRVGSGDGAKEAARLPGLAAEPVGQQRRAHSPASRQASAAAAHSSRTLPVIRVVTLSSCFGRFLRPAAPVPAPRSFSSILFRNGQRLCAGGGVRHRRAAGDHIQRVAQNIAQHDAEHLGRGAVPARTARP